MAIRVYKYGLVSGYPPQEAMENFGEPTIYGTLLSLSQRKP